MSEELLVRNDNKNNIDKTVSAMKHNENTILGKSFLFAIAIVKCYKKLATEKKEFVLSKQLLRSGTAVGALTREAQNAESKADFIHKLAIAQKECDETIYWLELMVETNYIEMMEYEILEKEANSLLKMIRSAILTTKKNLNKQR